MATFLERYQAGDQVGVWDDLTALGEAVRHEIYLDDAAAVAAETMRRARHNVELLIQRLAARGYGFLDTVSAAENRVSDFDTVRQLSALIETRVDANPGQFNSHSMDLVEAMRKMRDLAAPQLEKAARHAAEQAAASRKPPLQDPSVFSPPDRKTRSLLAKLEKAAGGPLPLSLRAWYQQVGGVSLMGSHPVLNAVELTNRGVVQQFEALTAQRKMPAPPAEAQYAADPLVIFPLEQILAQTSSGEEDEDRGGHRLQLAIAPDDLHKANVSGDAYYVRLPDSGADFPFDDWHRVTFVPYLRLVFEWGGFPGWARNSNPPRRELTELSQGLLPL